MLYNLISIPIDICLLNGIPPPDPIFVLNVFVDLFFIIDLMINFRIAFYEAAGLTPAMRSAWLSAEGAVPNRAGPTATCWRSRCNSASASCSRC